MPAIRAGTIPITCIVKMLMCSLVDKEAEREMQEELADYNGDDENEGEFEADKQAELAQF